MFTGKKFLVTGGTGSFGTTVTQALLRTDCEEIRIFSRDEKKQDDMRRSLSSDRVRFYLGDVRNASSLEGAVQDVDFIYHAAALKQVPSCEFFPIEAVQTNVIGTQNVLDSGVRAGVERIICLSTDKAAYPVNAMGISKAMMERVFMAHSRTSESRGTVIAGTRYGNVLASRGSVVPLFIEQCLSGQDLTITEPSMTRFLMTLEHAVDLVMFAFSNAQPGDLMIQKAKSARIGDLAQAIIELFESESSVKVIGLRHGEKKHEVLMTEEESVRSVDMDNYYRVVADNRDLNYGKYLDQGDYGRVAAHEYSSDQGDLLDVEGIKELLLQVPEVVRAVETRTHIA
ncbi:UDP-glucose 4-epimerase [Nocardioides sp. Root122]|uniref:polysaccharide biosynthesis protein n=1 Tax=Nocardioides TaxID=1839 RepID=UPI000702F33A|nr:MULTISPECIES: polysaccharide biosynthesis protein [Nocardioides]KQV77717.1 UDP-glucose 4-epimerase [Nocardioides sp. Root122]MCK9822182.1 polysaccharide biosynthesis protein [Nocardioides cavernae]